MHNLIKLLKIIYNSGDRATQYDLERNYMKKIYEAKGREKLEQIEIDNDYRAHQRQVFAENDIGIEDLVLVGKVKEFPASCRVDINWSLNGLPKKEGEYIIIEPLKEHINNVKKLNEVNTIFKEEIELSDRAIVLMPLEKYNTLNMKTELDKTNIRLYEGDEEYALEMLFFDKKYIYLKISENGYILDEKNHDESINYAIVLSDKIKEINKNLQRYVTSQSKYKRTILGYKENSTNENYKIISGLTKKVEGCIELDEDLYAATDIGKRRETQEDAVLIIKDKENPKFKMIAVVDGVGGKEFGDIASDTAINKLKEWFENLTDEQKKCFYKGVAGLKIDLQNKIERDIQIEVEYEARHLGCTTLVCAIVGEKDTLIANIGDSRAYLIKNGKLKQISREDTVAQKNLEKGYTPSKEAARFDDKSNIITQCIGMSRKDLNHPHIDIIDNKDYDMLVLFSDGVTDCLSDEDIAIVCKNSDRKDFAKEIVEKAIRHDSMCPEKYGDYNNLNPYIPGGKDNTTAAVYAPERE